MVRHDAVIRVTPPIIGMAGWQLERGEVYARSASTTATDATRSGAVRGLGVQKRRRRAVRAAWKPHIPCTPPPGGVEEEQMKMCGAGVS
jgi:hypothetical protein